MMRFISCRTQAIACMAIIVLVVGLSGCTEKILSRNYGGTTTVDLEPCKKLVVATWKDTNLWYLVRPMRPREEPETYEFVEDSSFGVFEGKVIFKEKACD